MISCNYIQTFFQLAPPMLVCLWVLLHVWGNARMHAHVHACVCTCTITKIY